MNQQGKENQPSSTRPNDMMNGHGKNAFMEVQIPVPWGHISGKWWGAMDMQPIVALHGWQDNAGTFDSLVEHLLPEISILSIDLPGHGFSSHLPKGQYYYLFWDGINTLRRIVQYYKWNKVKLLGHSLGGAIAFMYAGIFPKEVEFLICLDIASPNIRSPKQIVAETAANVDKFLSYENMSANNAPNYNYELMLNVVEDAYNGSITTSSAEILMKRGARETVPDKYAFARDPRLKVSILGSVSLDMVLEYASRIECQYMNIRASQGIGYNDIDKYQLVLDTIKKTAKKFVFHTIEGTHHVHLNEPHKVAPLIKEFLFPSREKPLEN